VRFIAYTSVGKFIATLQKGSKSPMPQSESDVIDERTDAEKETAAAKQRSVLAMANQTNSFETAGLLGMIYEAMSNDWPAQLSHLMVVQLFKKFSPGNRISRVELRTILKAVTMKVN
jgi:hypothetical protein